MRSSGGQVLPAYREDGQMSMGGANSTQRESIMPIEIDRRANLSLAEFEGRYVSSSLPVILTDATRHWPARNKWNLDYFESRFDTKQVHFDNKTWRVGELIRQLKSGTGEGRVPYLKMVKLDEQFPELWSDVGTLALAGNNRLQSKLLPESMQIKKGIVAVFIGNKGSGFRTLHWDYSHLHVFISQIVGDKEVVLFNPQDTPYVYPNPSSENTSLLPDPFEVNTDEFPEFRHAQPIRVSLKEGETLFLPAGWWHATYIEHANIAIAESTLDRFNWHQRKDWYLKQFRNAGVPWLKRAALNVYLSVVDKLIR
jgi:histone arginine demethylase JMJD6